MCLPSDYRVDGGAGEAHPSCGASHGPRPEAGPRWMYRRRAPLSKNDKKASLSYSIAQCGKLLPYDEHGQVIPVHLSNGLGAKQGVALRDAYVFWCFCRMLLTITPKTKYFKSAIKLFLSTVAELS